MDPRNSSTIDLDSGQKVLVSIISLGVTGNGIVILGKCTVQAYPVTRWLFYTCKEYANTCIKQVYDYYRIWLDLFFENLALY